MYVVKATYTGWDRTEGKVTTRQVSQTCKYRSTVDQILDHWLRNPSRYCDVVVEKSN